MLLINGIKKMIREDIGRKPNKHVLKFIPKTKRNEDTSFNITNGTAF